MINFVSKYVSSAVKSASAQNTAKLQTKVQWRIYNKHLKVASLFPHVVPPHHAITVWLQVTLTRMTQSVGSRPPAPEHWTSSCFLIGGELVTWRVWRLVIGWSCCLCFVVDNCRPHFFVVVLSPEVCFCYVSHVHAHVCALCKLVFYHVFRYNRFDVVTFLLLGYSHRW